jgi:D-alanine-D-alanine ligase-like ATP-grasp enzyme
MTCCVTLSVMLAKAQRRFAAAFAGTTSIRTRSSRAPSGNRSVRDRKSRAFGDEKVIAERYLLGREFTVAFLGNEVPFVLPISELTFRYGEQKYRPILSYQMKWVIESEERQAFRRICPAQLPSKMEKQLVDICASAYRICCLRGYGRIDVIWDTNTDSPYVIDVNANPDITKDQGLPYMNQLSRVGRTHYQVRIGRAYTGQIGSFAEFACLNLRQHGC